MKKIKKENNPLHNPCPTHVLVQVLTFVQSSVKLQSFCVLGRPKTVIKLFAHSLRVNMYWVKSCIFHLYLHIIPIYSLFVSICILYKLMSLWAGIPPY